MIFNKDNSNNSMVEYLLDKKKMLESLHYDEITDEDCIYYKSIIELLINLNVLKSMK